jgi:hypothetical protein
VDDVSIQQEKGSAFEDSIDVDINSAIFEAITSI